MTAFAGLVDRLFADPNLGRDATWEPAEGEPISVRVVARRADAVTEFGGAALVGDDALDVRVAEVADPRPGDRIVVDGEAFVVQGEPVRDRERLVWTLDARPDETRRGSSTSTSTAISRRRSRPRSSAAEKAVTLGVTRTGEALKAAWRAQVTGAGLGRRLANAIRANRYPRSGELISAASLVFSRAAEITDAFDRGVLIRSKHGLWLAIPTAEAGTRGVGRARITPAWLGAAHRHAAALRLPPRPPEPARRRRRPGQRARARRGEARTDAGATAC